MEIGFDRMLNALKAVGEETRLRILALFRTGELTVTELVTILRQSQPRISRHLRLLCEAGLLERYREGTWIFYRLSDGGPEGELARAIMEYIPFSEQILQHDASRLEEIKEERKSLKCRGRNPAAHFGIISHRRINGDGTGNHIASEPATDFPAFETFM